MATRGKSTASTALIPFECPQCDRHYRVELDFVKMRRLNRIAVCRGCDGRYTLSIRLESSAAPFDPDPYAAERLLADDERRRSANVRRLRDERPDRSSDPVLGQTKVGNVYIMNTDPPADSVVPKASDRPIDSSRPADSSPAAASGPPEDSAPPATSEPPGASPPPEASDWPPGLEPADRRRERERRSRLDTAPSRRSPLARQDTDPDKLPFVVDDSYPPSDSDVPPESDPDGAALSDRRPRRSGARYERTLGGVKRPDDSDPPPSGDSVGVHVIVEVGLVGDKSKRKTTKNYRPEHLITLPGLGVPQGKDD